MINRTQLEYVSEFLEGVTVVIVFEDDPLYQQAKQYFNEYGFGFMVPGSNLIIIDGEVLVGQPNSKDILKFIEAHEITHVLLGHDGPRNEQDEIEADLGAYILLQNKGYDESIKLLVNNFMERHGVEFNKKMVEGIKEKLNGCNH